MVNINAWSSEVKSRVGVVGAGSGGVRDIVRFMKHLTPKKNKNLWFLGINSDGHENDVLLGFGAIPEVRAWLRAGRLKVIAIGEAGEGAGGVPEVGREAVESKADEILSWSESKETIIAVAALGGGTGTAVLPFLAAQEIARDKTLIAVATMPFYEGKRRLWKAEDARQILLKTCPTFVVYNEKLPETSWDTPVNEAWDLTFEKCTLPQVTSMLEMFQRYGNVKNLDRGDVRRNLIGKHLLFGLRELEDNVTLKEFGQKLVYEDSLQMARIIEKAVRFILWYHGPWTKREKDGLEEYLWTQTEFPRVGSVVATKADLDEIIWGMVNDGVDKSKWVSMIAVATGPPDEEADNEAASTAKASARKFTDIHQEPDPLPLVAGPPPKAELPEAHQPALSPAAKSSPEEDFELEVVQLLSGGSKELSLPKSFRRLYRSVRQGTCNDQEIIRVVDKRMKGYAGSPVYLGQGASRILEQGKFPGGNSHRLAEAEGIS